MSPVKESLLRTIESLTEDEAQQVLDYLQSLRKRAELAHLRELLGGDPTFELPSPESPGFRRVKPIRCKGVPPSKLLVDDRR
jgi:hypothetical protein